MRRFIYPAPSLLCRGFRGRATPPAGSARGRAASQIVNHAFESRDREGQRPLADHKPRVREPRSRGAAPARKSYAKCVNQRGARGAEPAPQDYNKAIDFDLALRFTL